MVVAGNLTVCSVSFSPDPRVLPKVFDFEEPMVSSDMLDWKIHVPTGGLFTVTSVGEYISVQGIAAE